MRKPRRQSALPHFVSTLLGVAAGLSCFLLSLARSRSALIAENLFLRKQLAFYRERGIEPHRLTDAARICLVVWSRLFNWSKALVVVKPETLIRWHRKGFRLFWKWKSRGGRPRLPREIRRLIAEMASENPTWGEERIADELALKLGIYVSPRTVRAYWPVEPLGSGRRSTRPQHWRTLVRNHAQAIVACDFLVAVTARFQLLFVLVVMEIGTRRLHRRTGGCVRSGTEGPGGSGPVADYRAFCLRKSSARMAGYPHRLLVISAALSQVKSPYEFSGVDPNRILQSLVAILAGIGVPFLCTESHQLAEEVVASYLYQVHLYHWLESNDYGRFLADNDL